MYKSSLELASDKECQEELTRLFGKNPAPETKLAFFLAYDIGKKVMKKDFEEYYGVESLWSMCEDCSGTYNGHKVRVQDENGHCMNFWKLGDPIYPHDKEKVKIPVGHMHDHMCICGRESKLGTNLCPDCDVDELRKLGLD